jgi:acetoin utilization deacetylase AcuC-like enzyme
VLYVSIHQSHHYPYEGMVRDIDDVESKGTTVNIPLPAGTAGDVYRRAWEGLVLPVMREHAPSWVLVSCGYDAHAADPLGDIRLIAADFGVMAQLLGESHPPNRIIFALEGGYDLDALRTSAAATVGGVLGASLDESSPAFASPPQADDALEHAATAISRHWKV